MMNKMLIVVKNEIVLKMHISYLATRSLNSQLLFRTRKLTRRLKRAFVFVVS